MRQPNSVMISIKIHERALNPGALNKLKKAQLTIKGWRKGAEMGVKCDERAGETLSKSRKERQA